MPFDPLPVDLVDDFTRLRVVRDGVAGQTTWCKGELGAPASETHCLLGWLLVSTDWNVPEATRLAIDYLYPALPEKQRKCNVMKSLYDYNDKHGRDAVVALIDRAIAG